MNVYDSDRMTRLLAPLHFSQTDNIEEADLVLFNTCTVREKAKHKFLSDLGRLKGAKQKKNDLMIGVGGCVAQEEGENLLRRLPYLDFVFGVDQVDQLPTIVERIGATRQRIALTAWDTEPRFSLSYLLPSTSPVSTFVTIMKGCDKFCSFCIVPFTRGREKSRHPREILREIEGRVALGTREVMLLGQNVNSYLYEEHDFSALLRMVSDVPGLKRLRFTSPHPSDFCDKMIDCYATLPNLCKHLHLPVQAGNNEILKRMRRWYTIEHYKSRIKKLRERVPGVAISTDIIVGFPGESEEAFEDTIQLLKETRFDSLFSFVYSPRIGTKAAEYEDSVPRQEKERRLFRLQKLQDQISLEIHGLLIGTVVEVLVEKESPGGPLFAWLQGRTDTNKIVHFKGNPNLVGQFVTVQLTEAFPHSLSGQLTA